MEVLLVPSLRIREAYFLLKPSSVLHLPFQVALAIFFCTNPTPPSCIPGFCPLFPIKTSFQNNTRGSCPAIRLKVPANWPPETTPQPLWWLMLPGVILQGTSCHPVLLSSHWSASPDYQTQPMACQSQLLIWVQLLALFFLWSEVWLSFVWVAWKSHCARSCMCSYVCGLVRIDVSLQNQLATITTTMDCSG